jgi:hypothetical protein
VSRQSAHRWRLRCQAYVPAALYSPETLLFFCLWYSFLLEAEYTPGLVRPEGLGRINRRDEAQSRRIDQMLSQQWGSVQCSFCLWLLFATKFRTTEANRRQNAKQAVCRGLRRAGVQMARVHVATSCRGYSATSVCPVKLRGIVSGCVQAMQWQ